MAIKIHAGELTRIVAFKAPTVTINDEGGKSTTHAEAFTARAKIERTDQFRAQIAGAIDLVNTDRVTVRYSTERATVRKDWLLNYGGAEHIIHSVEYGGRENKEWILMIVKGSNSGEGIG